MQELDSFLNWCDTQYENVPHCQCGNACTNGNYCKGLQNNCYACIHRVHSYKNQTVHYNCSKMVLYYALKHNYRFGAEIFYEFYRLRKDIACWQDINIASIGCGPCSEAFGALSFWRTLGKADADFHFRGFDLEPLWYPIMNQVSNYFQDVRNYECDAFTYYEKSQERLDVLVLNYMLSDIKKFNATQYQNFLSNLINLIILKKPKYLLVNDIYLIISLAASSELIKALYISSLTFKYWKVQYHYFNPRIGQWGHQIQKQPFVMTNASIVQKYNPFSETNGIQTILKFIYDTECKSQN